MYNIFHKTKSVGKLIFRFHFQVVNGWIARALRRGGVSLFKKESLEPTTKCHYSIHWLHIIRQWVLKGRVQNRKIPTSNIRLKSRNKISWFKQFREIGNVILTTSGTWPREYHVFTWQNPPCDVCECSSLKLKFRQYVVIHTNYIISHCTILQYNHNIWQGT